MGNENGNVQYIHYYEDRFSQEDLEKRRLFLNDVVDSETVDSIVYHILRYNSLDKGVDAEERTPILLYINSPGGSVCDGFSVVDAINSSITPVYTINLALSASMAFLIYITGHKRFAFKNSEFLLHDGSVGVINSTAKAKDQIEFEANQISRITKDHVLSNTGISVEDYEKKERVEWYMLADEAKKLGVVDYIVGDDCSIDAIL